MLAGTVGSRLFFIVVVAEWAPLNFNNQQVALAVAFLFLRLVWVAGWLWLVLWVVCMYGYLGSAFCRLFHGIAG